MWTFKWILNTYQNQKKILEESKDAIKEIEWWIGQSKQMFNILLKQISTSLSSLFDSKELVKKSKFPWSEKFSDVLFDLIANGGKTDIRFHSSQEIADYAKVQWKLEIINFQYFSDPVFLDRVNLLFNTINGEFDSNLEIKEIKNPYWSKTYEISNKIEKQASFDSLFDKANSEVKEWLTNFQNFLLSQNISQNKIDKYLASWIISIVDNGYLKLWDVIIGKNETQTIEEQMKNVQWEKLIDFLTKTAEHFWLSFHKPNHTKNQLYMTKNKFIKDNNEFYNQNDWSNLFSSISKLINRSYMWIPCFATNDKCAVGCWFNCSDGFYVNYCAYSYDNCVSSKVS